MDHAAANDKKFSGPSILVKLSYDRCLHRHLYCKCYSASNGCFFWKYAGGRVYAYTLVTGIMCVGGVISFFILYRNCPETVKEDTSALEGLSREEIKRKHKENAIPITQSVKYLLKKQGMDFSIYNHHDKFPASAIYQYIHGILFPVLL